MSDDTVLTVQLGMPYCRISHLQALETVTQATYMLV